MNKNKDPRLRLIILILIILNVIIVQEGFLLSEKLYYSLFVTGPLLFYLLLKSDKRQNDDRSFNV
jgi:hypothetical protein